MYAVINLQIFVENVCFYKSWEKLVSTFLIMFLVLVTRVMLVPECAEKCMVKFVENWYYFCPKCLVESPGKLSGPEVFFPKRYFNYEFNLLNRLHIGIKLTKYVQGLCDDCYKTLIKILKDLNKWRNILTLWIRRLNFVKMYILPKLVFRFNTTHQNPCRLCRKLTGWL